MRKSSPQLRVRFARIAALLEPRLDEIAVALAELHDASYPGRENLPDLDAQRAATAVLGGVIRQLHSGERPGEREREELSALAHTWAEAGVDLDAAARAFQVGAQRVLHLLLADVPEGEEGNLETFVASADLAWDWSLLGRDVLAEVKEERAIRQVRRDQTLRTEFLRDLASGRVSPERLAGAAGAYGLDLELPYVTVCALRSSSSGAEVEAPLRVSGATETHRVLLATSEDEVLALCPRPPTAPVGATVAVGPAVLLSDAAASFAEARRVLATAVKFNVTGVVGLGSLGALPIITSDDELARRLDEERFHDLDSSFADVEGTVLTFLEQRQSVDAAARLLHVHGNTVRYRLGRFREMTRLDLHDTEDLLLAWWLLKWRQTAYPAERAAAGAQTTDTRSTVPNGVIKDVKLPVTSTHEPRRRSSSRDAGRHASASDRTHNPKSD